MLLYVLMRRAACAVEEPWFNEPGYEKEQGTPAGDAKSAAYNAQLRADTLTTALLPALRSPPPAFLPFLVQHFRRKHADIAAQLKEWRAAAARSRASALSQQLMRAADDAAEELQRYAPTVASGPVTTISLL